MEYYQYMSYVKEYPRLLVVTKEKRAKNKWLGNEQTQIINKNRMSKIQLVKLKLLFEKRIKNSRNDPINRKKELNIILCSKGEVHVSRKQKKTNSCLVLNT